MMHVPIRCPEHVRGISRIFDDLMSVHPCFKTKRNGINRVGHCKGYGTFVDPQHQPIPLPVLHTAGEDFYGIYDAQDFAKQHAPELGMQTVPSADVVYTEEQGYVTADVAKKEGLHVKKLSGTKFRQMLRAGDDIPEWFAFKSVVKVLREHSQKAS